MNCLTCPVLALVHYCPPQPPPALDIKLKEKKRKVLQFKDLHGLGIFWPREAGKTWHNDPC